MQFAGRNGLYFVKCLHLIGLNRIPAVFDDKIRTSSIVKKYQMKIGFDGNNIALERLFFIANFKFLRR